MTGSDILQAGKMTFVDIHSDDDSHQIALIFNKIHSLRAQEILPALDILHVCVDAGVIIPAFVISDDDNHQISLNLYQILYMSIYGPV